MWEILGEHDPPARAVSHCPPERVGHSTLFLDAFTSTTILDFRAMSQTEFDRENFRQWFKEPIDLLAVREHTGFALMMVALPILERFLRGRCGLKDKRLATPFYGELLKVFPTLKDVKGARLFWQSFRNGILHHATFSLKRAEGLADFSGVVGFQKLSGSAVMLRRSGNPEHLTCVVDPIAFARVVLAEVDSDLETFISADSVKHPIATVATLSREVFSVIIPP